MDDLEKGLDRIERIVKRSVFSGQTMQLRTYLRLSTGSKYQSKRHNFADQDSRLSWSSGTYIVGGISAGLGVKICM